MNKKMVLLIIFILLVVLGMGRYMAFNHSKDNPHENEVAQGENESSNAISLEVTNEPSDKKIAVVYFSATGTTKKVAEHIQNAVNADIFEIIPQEKYTSDDLNWHDHQSRTTKEQNDKSARPEMQNEIDLSSYDVVFLGYPIWWGDTPRIIQTFVETNALNGKTVIPFCTSGGSGISGSESTLKSYKGITWLSGRRLGTSQSEVEKWVKSIQY